MQGYRAPAQSVWNVICSKYIYYREWAAFPMLQEWQSSRRTPGFSRSHTQAHSPGELEASSRNASVARRHHPTGGTRGCRPHCCSRSTFSAPVQGSRCPWQTWWLQKITVLVRTTCSATKPPHDWYIGKMDCQGLFLLSPINSVPDSTLSQAAWYRESGRPQRQGES